MNPVSRSDVLRAGLRDSWGGVVKRRIREAEIGCRSTLLDDRNWQRCERWDGATQACLCWFDERQRELIDAGEWPGGDTAEFGDWLEMTQC
jgi:hypothetical protein